MSQHPLVIALDTLDEAPSAEFTQAMRARLYDELVGPRTSTDGFVVVDDLSSSETSVDSSQVIVTPTGDGPSRTRTLLGIAAALVLVGALALVALTRRSEQAPIDTTRDPATARAALMPVVNLGNGWEVSHIADAFTPAVEATVAASVPSCKPYVDYAFDSPNNEAAVSQQLYQSPTLAQLFNIVYVFPTANAASRAMDKISEPGFLSCFTNYLEAAQPVFSPGTTSTSDIVDAPPLLQHGDRQVAFATSNVFQTPTGPVPLTSVNVFIQVGRAVVYVNPRPDFHDSVDPKGRLEIVMRTATDSANAALAAAK
jgi:hypothetical protein